jgi:hypothetical protein
MSKAKGLFSLLDETAQAVKRGSGPGQAFINDLKKAGVKPAELKERGLDKIAAIPKMTKQELIKHVEASPPPKLKERILQQANENDLRIAAEELIDQEATEFVTDELGRRTQFNRFEWDDMHEAVYEEKLGDIKDYMRQAKEMAESGELAGAPRYAKDNLILPGGENHREILLKLPAPKSESSQRLMQLEARQRRGSLSETEAGELAKLQELAKNTHEYQSSHWDDPNVLAHMRVSDRKGPKGEKVLHVEEVQSDWHQEGKERGYASKDLPSQLKEYEFLTRKYAMNGKISPEEKARIEELKPFVTGKAGSIPDAPFKENWHELAMKRLLNYAAENGYDKIAITPARQQIDRYTNEVRKNIDSIEYEPYINDQGKQMFELSGVKDGKQVFSEEDVTPERLQKLLGKEMHGKVTSGFGESLAEERPMRPEWKRISGNDISIGGEGMKLFYDEQLPGFLNKYGQPYGSQVSPFDIVTHPEKSTPQVAAPGIDYFPEPAVEPAKTATLHGFDITPEMREELINKGLPLYKQGGQIKKRGRVHVSENPDTMLLDLMSRS